MRTVFGNYQLTFLSGGLLCLLAAGLVIRIGQGASPRIIPAPSFETESLAAD